MSSERRPDLVSFSHEDGTIHVTDEVESSTFELATPDAVDLKPALPALFHFPVDDAVSFETDELVVGPHAGAFLYDESGNHIGEFGDESRRLERGTYLVQIGGPMKLYVRVEDVTFEAEYPDGRREAGSLRLRFERPVTVSLGARSFHDQPHATITVPDDPAALMRAVSTTGGAIKEFSAERSWPTLRGHPPVFRIGDHLDVPRELSTPDTGVTITVPERYDTVYTIAPLAFYLGASVEPGESASLRLDTGYTHDLETTGRPLSDSVEETLSRCFFLDSLVRVGGYYSFQRYGYEEVAGELPFYPPNLYNATISEALMEYLEVDFSTIRPYVPRWPTVYVAKPDIESVVVLSDALNTLSPIRSPGADASSDDGASCYVKSSFGQSATEDAVQVTESVLRRTRQSEVPERNDLTCAILVPGDDLVGEYEQLARNRWARLPGENISITTTVDSDVLDADIVVIDAPSHDDTVESLLAERSSSPSVLITRDSPRGRQRDFEDDIPLLSIQTPGPLSPRSIGEFLVFILNGFPFSDALAFSSLEYSDVVGDVTTTACVRTGGITPFYASVDSEGTNSHSVSFRIPLAGAPRSKIGGLSYHSNESLPGVYQLMNTTASYDRLFSTDEVIELLGDTGGITDLNGELFLGKHPPNEDAIVRTVRRKNRTVTDR